LNQAKAVVEKVVIAPNILRSGERFEINPETAVKAIAESEKKEQQKPSHHKTWK
jgi:hypothetical protein